MSKPKDPKDMSVEDLERIALNEASHLIAHGLKQRDRVAIIERHAAAVSELARRAKAAEQIPICVIGPGLSASVKREPPCEPPAPGNPRRKKG